MTKEHDPQLYESGYERNEKDRYWTAPWMTRELIRHCGTLFPVRIWEPAVGRGDIARVLNKHGYVVFGSDIDLSALDPSTCAAYGRQDFLSEPDTLPTVGGRPMQGIITNPPYNVPRDVASKFIRRGLAWMDTCEFEFMAMLLRSEFRSAKTRRDIFGDCPHYYGELVLTTRPRWDLDDPDRDENVAPRHNFSWFMWKAWHSNTNPPLQIFSYMPRGFKP